jgi:uncharacterized RmlC-like cupin family protein
VKKGKVVKAKDLKMMSSFEAPISGQRGINSQTVEKPMMSMYHVFIPPGGRNQRHYHLTHDAGGYILKGRVKMFFGPDHEMEEDIAEEGDFFYYPLGVIHGLMNLSDTEAAEMITCHAGVSNLEEAEAGTVFVEPRKK